MVLDKNLNLASTMLKICFYGSFFGVPIIKELEKNGHTILYNQFSKDADIVLAESHMNMYEIYQILKKIKKYKLKLVNLILDIPPWRLSVEGEQYGIIKLILQYFYHIVHKHYFLDRILTHLLQLLNKYKRTRKFFRIINFLLNSSYKNKMFYQVNYKKLLKKSDLNLSISKFTQFCVKKLLNVDSKVWYPSVNSKLIESIKDLPIKYDMINISRILPYKRQNLIVNASKKLGLKLLIIGQQQNKEIKLDCPHFHIPDHLGVMRELKKSHLYIDASIFEGFGMTPIEAAFSEKITIASDTYIHREVLGNYPLYFIKDDLNDLMKKIKQALNGEFQLDKEAVDQIKIKYSLEAAKDRLEELLNSI